MDKQNMIVAGANLAIAFLTFLFGTFFAGGFMGLVLGLVVFAAGGLVHEFMMRKEGFRKAVKGVIGLREKVDRIEKGIDGIQKDVGKAAADARGANTAVQQFQEVQELAQKTAQEFEAFKESGGGVNGMAQTVEQLQGWQQQTASDIEVIQNAGNLLHGEFQAMQQSLEMQQQQFAQFQAMIQQMQGTVNAMLANPGAPAPAPQPEMQPAPQMADAHGLEPDFSSSPAMAPPPMEAPAPDMPMEQPMAEMPAEMPAEQPQPAAEAPQPAAEAPAAAPAAPAAGLLGAVLQDLEANMGQAAGSSAADQSLKAIADGLKSDAVDLYIEPIVTLPERKLSHYECYGGVRGADGNPLAVDANLDPTGREKLMTAIENALLTRCLDRIAALDVAGMEGGACFYNVAGMTLGDRGFFAGLIEHLKANPQLAQRIVLEFPQTALMEHGEQAVQDLVQLQETGCRFSIDEITDLEIDFESLVGFGFRFVKVGSKFMRVQANTADDPETVRGLAKAMKDIGIDVVVERVETDLSLVELIEFDITLGQGPLFGQPDAGGQQASNA